VLLFSPKRSKKKIRQKRYKKQTFEKKNEAAAKAATRTTEHKVGQQKEA
jgi:hypothetical protein